MIVSVVIIVLIIFVIVLVVFIIVLIAHDLHLLNFDSIIVWLFFNEIIQLKLWDFSILELKRGNNI